jgi:ribosomal protein S18 acetylase RimI-like enzyme
MRYLTPSVMDADRLADVGARLFVDTFGKLYNKTDLKAFLAQVHSPEAVARELADPAYAFRVVEDADAYIGYAKVGPVSVPIADTTDTLELKQLYVHRAFHGQGVAPVLMLWALRTARARGARRMVLSVFQQNPRAQAFYARYGFTVIGSYQFKVGSHLDDEFIMAAEVPAP